MVFKSNPGFIFHDSRGFEAGGESEFDKVKAFIASRSKEVRLRNQLHAIWYCIPMDEASRSFTSGEIKFFSQCDTGSIPVIVLFTKFDALYDESYAQLKSQGASMEEAEERAPKHAEESFAIGSQLKFLYHSKEIRRPPKCHICLPNMDSDDADCGLLIERTAGTLDNEVLQQLFVSTQQTNLELCMKYAVEKSLMKRLNFSETTTSEDYEKMVGLSAVWFPHIMAGDYDEVSVSILVRARAMLIQVVSHRPQDDDEFGIKNHERLDPSHRTEMRSRLLSTTASDSSPVENIVQFSSAVVIVFEHSFYIFDKRRHLHDQRQSVPSFYVALEQYMASEHAAAVREGMSAAVQAYEERVRIAVHTSHGNLNAFMAKLPFKRLQKKAKESLDSQAQAKAELIKTILEISLNHRLPRP